MKRILYLSIVDWNWIKQRPQMIAEELSKDNEVYCIYPKYHKKHDLVKNDNLMGNLHLLPRFKIPFSGRYSIIKKLDSIYQHFIVAKAIWKYKPDCVYTSVPTDYSLFFRMLKTSIVYDCMDNYPEFEKRRKDKKYLMGLERKLINISSKVFVSSEYLLERITENYNVPREKLVLVRNGYSGDIIDDCIQNRKTSKKIKLAYIGTVSSWFDFDVLAEVCSRISSIEVHVIGPVNVEKPVIKNLIFDGVVNHDQLYESIKEYDALIMPFKVNSIIEAVDPVKLYEYINFNKPIISVYYNEIRRFEKFVHFYTDSEFFIECVEKIKSGESTYSNQERIGFLRENNWKERVRIINDTLSCI